MPFHVIEFFGSHLTNIMNIQEVLSEPQITAGNNHHSTPTMTLYTLNY